MERKDRIPEPKSLTLREAAEYFGTEEDILRLMVNAGILTPEKGPGTVRGRKFRIRPSQFWKVERALEEKSRHPQWWEWSDIARAIPRMRPREY